MRADVGSLLANQKLGKATPNVDVYYYTTGRPSDAGGSWTQIDNLGSSSRVLSLDHYEETYGSGATIYLDNSDGSFDAYDLREKWIKIGWGIGSDISDAAYLKVTSHRWVMRKNRPRDTYYLGCSGAWNLLARYKSPYSYFFNQTGMNDDATCDNLTAKGMLDYIMELAGLDLGTSISECDYINVLKPKMDMVAGLNGMQMILMIMSIFQDVLIPRTDCMHLKAV